MANKPQGKSWGEVQLTIAALAVTATLGFWNLFSTPGKAQAGAKATETAAPPPPLPTETAEPTSTASALRPVKIIFGGQAPQQPVVQVQVQSPQTAKKKHNGGNNNNNGGGGGGGGSAPPQPPSTGSSK